MTVTGIVRRPRSDSMRRTSAVAWSVIRARVAAVVMLLAPASGCAVAVAPGGLSSGGAARVSIAAVSPGSASGAVVDPAAASTSGPASTVPAGRASAGQATRTSPAARRPDPSSAPSALADVLVPAPDTDATDAGVCRTPTSRVAPMILAHTTGPLSAGETPTLGPLDTQTLYIADGPPGLGVLCHGTTVAGPPAVRAIAPAPGAVPYLVADNDFGVWGAVGPGVARVELTLQGYPWGYSFRIDSPSATTDLRDLGDGWHAFNTDVGFSPTPPTTATAYDDAGHELGTRTVRRHG